jgi:AcrR family transcriptional regulator
MPSKSYHHGDLRSELIKEGLKILDQVGYEKFSIRKVAKECRVSQTALYRHFTNKDELIRAIASEVMQEFNSTLEQAIERHPDDPKLQLKAMGIAYIGFFVNNPEYLRLLFISNIRYIVNHDLSHPEVHYTEGHPFNTLYKNVERYKASSPTESLDQMDLLLYCWGLVHGIAVLIASNEIPFVADYSKLVSNIFDSNKF